VRKAGALLYTGTYTLKSSGKVSHSFPQSDYMQIAEQNTTGVESQNNLNFVNPSFKITTVDFYAMIGQDAKGPLVDLTFDVDFDVSATVSGKAFSSTGAFKIAGVGRPVGQTWTMEHDGSIAINGLKNAATWQGNTTTLTFGPDQQLAANQFNVTGKQSNYVGTYSVNASGKVTLVFPSADYTDIVMNNIQDVASANEKTFTNTSIKITAVNFYATIGKDADGPVLDWTLDLNFNITTTVSGKVYNSTGTFKMNGVGRLG
jgi:hypothetical protein